MVAEKERNAKRLPIPERKAKLILKRRLNEETHKSKLESTKCRYKQKTQKINISGRIMYAQQEQSNVVCGAFPLNAINN